jgi:hypothetical protein
MPAESQREVRDLNGHWQIWFDEQAPWQDEAPALPGAPLRDLPVRPPTGGWGTLAQARDVLEVPGTWATVRPGYHGVAWQWRTLDVPTAWRGQVIRVLFGAVRLRAEVYLDETLVGYDLEGYTPFEVDLTAHAVPGQCHRLAVRITNPGGSHSWEDTRIIQWAGLELPPSHDVGGIWGDVAVVATPPAYIRDVFAMPQPEARQVNLRVELSGAPGSARLSALVRDPRGMAVASAEQPVSLTAKDLCIDIILSIPRIRSWSPSSPLLYSAEVALSTANATDATAATFGFRLFQARNAHLYLNDTRIFFRSAISWGWYPRNLAFPEGALAHDEVAIARRLGLNALNAHRMVASPRLLREADAQGLMIHQEPGGMPRTEAADWPTTEAQHFRLALAEERLRRLVRRDRNHPSLVWWNIGNESRTPTEGPLYPHVARLLDMVHTEDPTRLVTWTSGWGYSVACNPYAEDNTLVYDTHQVLNWPNAWHSDLERMIRSLGPSQSPAPFLSGESLCFDGLSDVPALLRRFGEPVLPGSDADQWRGWLSALEEDYAAFGLRRTFRDLSAFCRATCGPQSYAVSRMVECHRLNPACDGLAINGWMNHQILGTSGIVDIWRQPQVDPGELSAAQAPLTLALVDMPAQMALGACVAVRLWALNELGPQPDLLVRMRLTDPRGMLAGAEDSVVSLRGASWQEYVGPISLTPSLEGRYDLSVDLLRNDRSVGRTRRPFWVTALPEEHSEHVAVMDVGNRLGDLRARWGVTWTDYWMGNPADRLLLVDWYPDWTLYEILRTGAGHAGRVAVLFQEPARDLSGLLGLLGRLGGPFDKPCMMPMQPHHIGSWAFSHRHALLEGVADPGMWGHMQAGLFPRAVLRGVTCDTLVGGCSFPTFGLDDPDPPRLGTALGLLTLGQLEVLLCTLPVAQAAHDGLLSGERLLDSIVRWVASKL